MGSPFFMTLAQANVLYFKIPAFSLCPANIVYGEWQWLKDYSIQYFLH